MSLITPAGKSDFDWVPKDLGLQKVASSGKKPIDDREALFDAAKRFLAAQAEEEKKKEKEDKPEDKMEKTSDDVEEVEVDEKLDADMPSDIAEGDATEEVVEEGVKTDDVQAAVAELAEKAEKAEQVAEKVEEAVEKVEEAVQGVRDAVGGEAMEAVIDMDTDDMGDEAAGDDEIVEIELENEPDNMPEEVELEIMDSDGIDGIDQGIEEVKEDEIVSGCGCAASSDKKVKLNTVSRTRNEFEKISKISPQTRNKVLTYWSKYLGYEPDFCKLLVKNYEK